MDWNTTLNPIIDVHLGTILLLAGAILFTVLGFLLRSKFIIRIFTTGFLSGFLYSIIYNMYSGKITSWDVMAVATTSAIAGYILSMMVPEREGWFRRGGVANV